MERALDKVTDKAIVLACCLASLAVVVWEPLLLVALLCAVVASAFAEVLPERFSFLPPVVYAFCSLPVPAFSMFLGLAAYDLARDERLIVRGSWLFPVLVTAVTAPIQVTAIVILSCVVAVLLGFRMKRIEYEQIAYRRKRDDLQEASLALEEKNRGLREKQDLEVHLATLAERGRIAREIHDNVGHLLTRSIMQVEALQVVHRDDEKVKEELAQVGTTLHEAMSTVRASVHDLRDDAFDLEAQLTEIVQASVSLAVKVDYRAENVPSEVGYCFVAIVREALSNATRHSDANKVEVSVVEYPAFYRLIVRDNGSVAPAQAILTAGELNEVSSGRGMGLRAMSDRARALGGVLRLDYSQGFKVFVSIPKEETS